MTTAFVTIRPADSRVGVKSRSSHTSFRSAEALEPHPSLRVIEGGLSRSAAPRNSAAVYVRRRICAVALLVVGALVLGSACLQILETAAHTGLRPSGPELLPAGVSERPGEVASMAGVVTGDSPSVDVRTAGSERYVVVKAGDTLWSIARRIQPDGDIRPVVDELVKRAGGSKIDVGQKVRIDGIGR